jgi:prepilin-type N-terminal cleavage/methylation domain-containing protein
MPARSKSFGFTLIELLVVIAIIAMLAAILFPVFAKAREKSFQTQCMNNQKQLATSMLMYAQDNEETLPAAKSWASAIKVDASKLFDCPTSTQEGNDYMYFASMMDNGTVEGMLSSMTLGDLPKPSETPLLTDVKQKSDFYVNFGAKTYLSLKDLTAKYDPRHNGGQLVAWMDGHLSYVKAGGLTRATILNLVTDRDQYIFYQQSGTTSTESSSAPANIEMGTTGYYGFKRIGLLEKVPAASDDYVLEFDASATGNVPYPFMLLGVGVPAAVPNSAAGSANLITTYPLDSGYVLGAFYRTDIYWDQSRLKFYTNPSTNFNTTGGGGTFSVNGGYGNACHFVMSVTGTKKIFDMYKDPTSTLRLCPTRVNDFTPPQVSAGTQLGVIASKLEQNGNVTVKITNLLIARP